MPLIERSADTTVFAYTHIREHQIVSDPKIAIVVPALNEQKLLPHALASIDRALEQISDPVRVVIVDNNSTDRTGQLARDSGAFVVFEEKRRISSARQAGLYSLPDSVEMVLTTDADSIVPRGWVGAYIHLLNQTATVGAYGPVKYDHEESPPIGQALTFWLLMTTSGLLRRMKGKHGMSIGSGANSAYRLRAAREIGGYNTALSRAEDTDLFRRLQDVGKIENTHATVTTSNRRIVNRGLFQHFLRRLYANYYHIRNKKWPVFQTDLEQNIRL